MKKNANVTIPIVGGGRNGLEALNITAENWLVFTNKTGTIVTITKKGRYLYQVG